MIWATNMIQVTKRGNRVTAEAVNFVLDGRGNNNNRSPYPGIISNSAEKTSDDASAFAVPNVLNSSCFHLLSVPGAYRRARNPIDMSLLISW